MKLEMAKQHPDFQPNGGSSKGQETSAPNQENCPEVSDSPITEPFLNQDMSDWGSLCETLTERSQQNPGDCLVNKTTNGGEVAHTTSKEPSVSIRSIRFSLFPGELFLFS